MNKLLAKMFGAHDQNSGAVFGVMHVGVVAFDFNFVVCLLSDTEASEVSAPRHERDRPRRCARSLQPLEWNPYILAENASWNQQVYYDLSWPAPSSNPDQPIC